MLVDSLAPGTYSESSSERRWQREKAAVSEQAPRLQQRPARVSSRLREKRAPRSFLVLLGDRPAMRSLPAAPQYRSASTHANKALKAAVPADLCLVMV